MNYKINKQNLIMKTSNGVKTKILPIIILSLLFTGGSALATTVAQLPDPGLTPDSPFYFLERITEAVGTFFTFGDVKKAERYIALATERMAEAEAVMEKTSLDKTPDKKLELVEKTLARYEDQLVKASYRAEKARLKGKDTQKVTDAITEATDKHLIVLKRVLEKVPEQAKSAIEHAITVSTKDGLEKAVVEFKQKSASGQDIEAIKAKCVEMGAPSNVCNSIGEALASSKPLRTLCLEQGGTQEMCEMMPSENFKSFKQIRDFCTEQGGPTEICKTLEDKCKELGVTKADSCFRVLSISSVTTYQSTELKMVPQPVSEEFLEEKRLQKKK